MRKQYWLIIFTYALTQFSGILGVGLLLSLGVGTGETKEVATQIATSYWTVFSFAAAFLIILFFLREEMNMRQTNRFSFIAIWSILGVILALAAQTLAGMIETNLLGIEPGSENTEFLLDMFKTTPLLIIVIIIIAPILEEIIFRKIIFGSLAPNLGFFFAAVISSFIFGALHMDFEHMLIYTSMGLVFAFLYVKTQQILVPILAHVMMNTFVVVGQTIFADRMNAMEEQVKQLQLIFGG
ncbi:CPBP family intramembrane glutamic endopeptidase [Metabacillus idriensis]|uniref:CPBP family intramembrane glutamic endopeptidase n=1 Tax=Metabacillus idriensis TaxID=324768 RepID=UPI0017492F2D|nr:type II CAAX endopeptidase family protein [Metabacillus idriensis]